MGKDLQKLCFRLLFMRFLKSAPPSPARGFENVTRASGQARNSLKLWTTDKQTNKQTIQFESLRK